MVHRSNSVCHCIESILQIRDPLKRLYDENAFDDGFQRNIPTEEMFDTMSKIVEPLKIIKKACCKLLSDENSSIQHALTIIIQLGNLANVQGAT